MKIYRRFYRYLAYFIVLTSSFANLGILASSTSSTTKDPYDILGINRESTNDEIRKAYKSLAKRWHPDKNPDPDAERHFVEVNRAYALLNDPERREQFDRYGATMLDDGEDEFDGGGQSQQHAGGERNPFADFHFGSFGQFQYQFHNSGPTVFKKHDVGLRLFETSLVNKSHTKPFLMFVYADWCESCMKAERLWEYVVSELEPDGYGIATINSKLEGSLIDHLRIRHLPAVVALVEGRPLHYRGITITAKGLFEFSRQVLPKSLVTTLNDVNYRKFLEENWRRNKASVIVSSPDDEPNLRIVLAAMRYRTWYAFGYVSTNSTASIEFRTAYGLSTTVAMSKANMQTMLIFNERISTPVATVRDEEMSTTMMNAALEANKFLLLPRLSSQTYFDDLCPPSPDSTRYCAILLVRGADTRADDGHVTGFRDLLSDRKQRGGSTSKDDAVKFVYVYEDRQKNFIESLATGDPEHQSGSGSGSSVIDRRHVVIVWRTETQRARVHWLRHIWSANAETMNRSAELILAKLDSIVRARNNNNGESKTPFRVVSLKPLIDEDHPPVYKRLASRLVRSWETFLHHVGKDEFLPAISVLGTLLVMILIGYGLNRVLETEKKAEDARKRRKDKGKPIEETKEFKTLFRELRAETYFGMVRMLKPGFRSIVVLVDAESKDVLVKQFARAVWPWRKNKTLLFGYVMLDKNLDWFRQILEAALADPSLQLKQSINMRNVVGTVLSLNGFRQFFSMYHPKHAPSMIGFRAAERRRMQDGRHFLGLDAMDESDDENYYGGEGNGVGGDRDLDEDTMDELDEKCGGKSGETAENAKEFLKTKVLKVDELLDGLPNWLERLFRGSARRYYVAEWPTIR